MLLEVGEGRLPHDWVKQKINRIFPTRMQKQSAKEPMSGKLVEVVMKHLHT